MTKKRYSRMNAAPPLVPTMYGKRQMLPKPTAEPAITRSDPRLLEKFSLFSILL